MRAPHITAPSRDSIRPPVALIFGIGIGNGGNIVTSGIFSRFAMAGIASATLCVAPAAHAAVTISSAATSNMSCSGGVCSPTAANAVLNVGDLTSMLASGNVTVNTGTGSLAQQVEDILVASTFNWASANALTLDAYRSVTFTAPVAVNGAAPVTLVTNDGGSGGNLLFASGGSLSFLGTANSLSINGAVYTLVADIHTLANDVASAPAGNYALASSYDASRDGTYAAAPVAATLDGAVEGLGNAITNLAVNIPANAKYKIGVGLFAQNAGRISNVTLGNLQIDVYDRCAPVGGLAGYNAGAMFGDTASGNVSSRGTFKHAGCYGFTGGLAGDNGGTILSSGSSAKVEGISPGGLVGINSGSIALSRATGPVSSSQGSIGGLSGWNDGSGTISQCFATGQVTGGGSYTGGLVGYNGTEDSVTAVISDSYATGSVKGGQNVGGLSGYNGDEFQPATVEYSYSTGAGSGRYAGGLLGSAASTLIDNYWDTTTSGTRDGIPGGNIAGVTGLTSKQFRTGLPSGFDPTIWAESPDVNKGLPYLINNPPQ